MNKKQIEQKTLDILDPIAVAEGTAVYDIEYIKEGGEYFLRCFLKKEDGNITIDDCVNVSRKLSDALDEANFISDSYTLEVSSKGLGRTLTNDRQLSQEIGQSIDVKLYKARDGVKAFTGILKSFDKDSLIIESNSEDITFSRKEIANVKLTLNM